MAPNLSATAPTGVLFEDDSLTSQQEIMPPREVTKPPRKGSKKIVWRNVLLFIYLHIAAFYGAWLALTSAKILTSLFGKLNLSFGIISFFLFPENQTVF